LIKSLAFTRYGSDQKSAAGTCGEINPLTILDVPMQLVVIGTNHVTASIEVREKFAVTPERHNDVLRSVIKMLDESSDSNAEPPAEAVLLSTCNRTEIVANRPMQANQLIALLGELAGQQIDKEHFFIHTGDDAWRHLAGVASGLESLALGEPQIFGQLKSAYALADAEGTVGSDLGAIFQHIFSVAKRVRHDTAIGENPISVAYAAVSLVKRIFESLAETSVLLIGAGETVTLVAKHLREAGVSKLVVANRNLVNASTLAEQFDAGAILLADIPECLADHDIVISSTASQLPLLGKGSVETAIKQRKRKPMFMLDLAVPRDIEPQVADLRDVYLYTVDDLREVIDENVERRKQELGRAETLIEQGLETFKQRVKQRSVSSLLVDYRKSMSQLAQVELEKALRQLSSSDDPEQALKDLTRNLSRKLMHEPTLAIREAARSDDAAFLESVEKLLGLTKRERNEN